MHTLVSDESILGLFPALDSLGGVQASGKIAWEGIAGQPSSRGALLFCYGEGEIRGPDVSFPPAVRATSKLRALTSALRMRSPVSRVLIWHVGLLKLLPFFRIRDAKVALFLHGIEVWRKQDGLTNRLLGRIDLFLSNSDYTWQRFIEEHPRLANVPHQIVHLGMHKALEEPAPDPGAPPAVLMTSRLVRSEDYKGHREIINVWPKVLKRIPDAELWVCGDGDLKEVLESLTAKLGIGHRIHFFGRVSEEKKTELLIRSRCFALPSRGEGFGLVYLEAMRMGRPCLVSTADAGREVVNPPEAGLAADLTCPQELADAVCHLLEPSDWWGKASSGARQRHGEFFTAEHFQRRLNSALATL